MPAPTRPVARMVGALGVALAACAHLHGHRYYLGSLDTRQTLYPLPLPPPPFALPAPPGARRLFVLVLDGLRDDAALGLPHVRALLPRAAHRALLAGFPSFTFASLTTMTTGVPPLYSGVRLNTGKGRAPLDSLLRGPVPTLVAREGFGRFPLALDPERAPRGPRPPLAQILASAPAREMIWVHFDDIDAAGHARGARSAGYREAALRGDALLGQLADALDPSLDALVALSDHGHLDRGGHGGVEPEALGGFFLALGAGVAPGVERPPGRMVDVGATLAALAGEPPPRENLGAPMLDVLSGSEASLAAKLAPAWAQRANAERAWDPSLDPVADAALGQALVEGRPGALAHASAELAAREQRREARTAARARQRQALRLAVAAGLSLLALGLARALHRRGVLRLGPLDLLPGLVFAAAFALLYAALGYGLSFSVQKAELEFLRDTAAAGIGAAAAALGAMALLSRAAGRPPRPVEQSFAALVGFALADGLWASAAGLDPRWLAGPTTSFGVIAVSTLTAYGGLAFGLCALRAARRPPPAPAPYLA